MSTGRQRGFISFDDVVVVANSKLGDSNRSSNGDEAAVPLTLPGPASSSRLLDTTGLQQLDATASFIGQPLLVDDSTATTTSATTTSSAVLYQLSTGELVGVIVAASLVTAALIGLVIWLQWRNRRKRKGAAVTSSSSSSGNNGQQQQHQVSIISMESTKSSVSRQNSVANGIGLGYNNNNAVTSFTRNGPDDGSGGQQPSAMDDEVFTEYGSIVGSFPPSPTLSFRSAIDAPGFNRSRAGTGTSFGTVASFSSYRSRLSNTASFHTCVQEDFI